MVEVGDRAGGGGCESQCRHPPARFPLPPEWDISLYLKDESVHPTGSLKHRLARSLVLYGLCNNWITAGHHTRRGVLWVHRGQRGLLRAAAQAAVRGRDAGVDGAGEDAS